MEGFVRQTLERARQVGNRRAQALCYHALGAVRYLLGDWQESRAAFETSVTVNQTLGGIFGQVLGLQHLALLDIGLGHHAAAQERLEAALAMVEQSDSALVRMHAPVRLFGTLARNRLETGDLPRAAAYLAQGFAAEHEAGECASCGVLLYPAAVPIYLALGDFGQAEYACRRAEEAAAVFRSRAWVATARYLSGLLATARSGWREAAGYFTEALGIFEALEQVYDVARTMEALAGVAAHGAGDLPDLNAEALRTRAAAMYTRLGAEHAARRVTGG